MADPDPRKIADPRSTIFDAARTIMGAVPDPPQRKPWTRLLFRIGREAVWPIVWLMALGHRFGRTLLRTEYTVTGGCLKRGACCQHVLVEWAPILDTYPWLGRIVLWKLTRFYRFYDKGFTWEVQDGLLVRVLGCHALRTDGQCGEYRLRPLFCRTYPEVPLTGRPQVLRGCGYRSARRDGEPEPIEGSELIQIGGRERSLSAPGPSSNPTHTSVTTRLAK